MKANGYIVLGLIAIFFSSAILLQIVDTTKPDIRNDLMHPQAGDVLNKLSHIWVLVRDYESSINEIKFNIWKEDKPATQYQLQHLGIVFHNLTSGLDYFMKGFVWEWEALDPDIVAWQWWGINLTAPITQTGTYSFWFIVYNGAGLYSEPTIEQNTFDIQIDGQQEEQIPGDDSGDFDPVPSNDTPGWTPPPQGGGFDYGLPILIFSGGAIIMVYGFLQKKKVKI